VGGSVCIILHLSACTGVNTSVVWSKVEVLLRMGVVWRDCPLHSLSGFPFYSSKEKPRVQAYLSE